MARRLASLACLALLTASAACGGGTQPGPNRADLGGFIGPAPGPGPTPDLASPPDGATAMSGDCNAPIPIVDGTMLSGQDTSTSTATLGSGCAYGDGTVLFYSTTIPAASKLSVNITPTDGTFDPVVRLLDACGASSCSTYADAGYAGDPETLVASNTGTAPRDVIVAVGGYDTGGGTFDLAAQVTTLPANASCATPEPVTPGPALTGQDARGGGETIDACLSGSDGGVLYYARTLPARTELVVNATPTGGSWDPSLRLLDGCGATTCLAGSDDAYTDEVETLTYRNRTTSPQAVLIAVGSTAPAAGTFDLQLTETALPPPPANAVCAGALALVDGTTLSTQDVGEGIDDLTAACESGAAGGVLYYTATVPARSRLDVHVTPQSGLDPVVRILPACGAASCLASADRGYSGDEETASYENSGTTPVSVVVAVGGYSASDTGTFDLDAHITALPMPATNLTCASATAVSSGMTYAAQDQTAATETESALCVAGGAGGVVFYQATVPSGDRLLARVTPASSWDPVVRLLSSCGASSCLSSADASASGGGETLSYKNTSGSSQSLVFTVGSYSSTATGVFDLSTYVLPPPTNTSCASASAVSSGAHLPAEDGESATTAATSACLPSATGDVLFYKVSIPAGKSLQVDVTPLGAWDPVVRLLSACGASSCLASQDAGYAGDAESLTYANGSPSSVAVIVAVGGYGASGLFDLAVTIL